MIVSGTLEFRDAIRWYVFTSVMTTSFIDEVSGRPMAMFVVIASAASNATPYYHLVHQ